MAQLDAPGSEMRTSSCRTPWRSGDGSLACTAFGIDVLMGGRLTARLASESCR